MGRQNALLLSYNRGEVSKHALARVDTERLRLSAEIQENWMPWVIGPMMLRPGTSKEGEVANGAIAKIIPFIFGKNDTALIELVDSTMRVRLAGQLISRVAVSTTVPNGDFSSATGWTLTTGATISGGLLHLANSTAGSVARCSRTLSVISGDQNKEHALRIIVSRGPVTFRAGSASGSDDYIQDTVLDTGYHSLSFTPTGGSVFIQLETTTPREKQVDSIQIEASGVMEIPTTWIEADLPFLRRDQSGDIIFIACDGQRQSKIERRATRSWSCVRYYSNDGPFQNTNVTDTTMTPGALNGNTTLTASQNFFRPGHVGTLFRLFSQGQDIQASIAAANTFSNAIRISGTGEDRRFSYIWTGTWSGTLTLQRSFDGPTSGFTDVAGSTWTGNTSSSFKDSFDNSIIWYRVGFKTGQYTSGTAGIELIYTGGGAAGICRVTGYTDRQHVDVEIINAFSSLNATTNWKEGDWGDIAGWPSAARFHEGRLGWFGRDRMWLSVSDAFASFDQDTVGDSGPIIRSFGSGPIQIINWALSLSRLIIGREMSEGSVRSSSLDDPLTPTNFSIKDCSTQGSAKLPAIKIDQRGIFVQQSGRRIFNVAFDASAADYRSSDLTRLNIEIGKLGFVDIEVRRQPDTEIHLVRADGQVVVLLYDPDDEVVCFWRVISDGAGGQIESVAVLPGDLEDEVWYVVKRTIAGTDRRFIEKLSRRDECIGATISKCADSHIIYQGAPATVITGLNHLEGKQVVVWADGKDVGTNDDGTLKYSVASGQITLDEAASNVVVGLPYAARFKSAKLAYAAQGGTALTQKKSIDHLGLVMCDTHYQGMKYGQSFDVMDALPLVEDGEETPADTIWDQYDKPAFELPGEWNSDARLCLTATAPRPATAQACVVGLQTNET